MNETEAAPLRVDSSLKALTIRAPWAWAIVQGVKRVENRGWKTSFRGRLAIHAGSSLESDSDASAKFAEIKLTPPVRLTRGAIVGTVELVDVLLYDDFLRRFDDEPFDRAFACGPYCWVLRDPIPCLPLKCPGNFQLWNVERRLSRLGENRSESRRANESSR